MHATIRRYDGVDQNRTVELTGKVNETLIPKLSNLDGFKGYYLIEAGNGIFSSIGLFETPEQGEASTKVASTWVRDEKLETAFPNPPKITSGKVVGHKNSIIVRLRHHWNARGGGPASRGPSRRDLRRVFEQKADLTGGGLPDLDRGVLLRLLELDLLGELQDLADELLEPHVEHDRLAREGAVEHQPHLVVVVHRIGQEGPRMTRCERRRARRVAPSSLSTTTSTACPGSAARNVTSTPAQRPTGGAVTKSAASTWYPSPSSHSIMPSPRVSLNQRILPPSTFSVPGRRCGRASGRTETAPP